MSPRSEEFFARAEARAGSARLQLEGRDMGAAVSLAYYAMLYAARAALSELDLHARTHRGTWALFRERYVAAGRFDDELFSRAQRAQDEREQADYEAADPSREQAADLVALAERFVDAVRRMLAGSSG